MLYIGNTRYKITDKLYDAEIEYLLNTGTQWIDTGVYGSHSLDYEIKTVFYNTSDWPYIFGAESAQRVDRYSLMFGTNYRLYLNDGTLETNYTLPTNKRTVPIVIKKTGGTIYLDGTSIATFSSQTYTTPAPIYLWKSSSPSYNKIATCKIYYLKIGNLDLIPVRKGNIGYLYDKVSGKLFENKGTGDFILGPDIQKPYDSEVLYIESTGTQYINTGIGFTKSLSTRILFCLTKLNSNNSLIYGAWADNSSAPKTQFLVNSSNVFAPVYETEYVSARLTDGGSLVTGTSAVSNKFYDITITSGALPTSSLNCYLFARDNDVNNYLPYNGMRLYACKMTLDGVVVRDFIPVRKNRVGYLYDKISNQLFGNIGTGDFIIGPDINIRTRRIVTNSVIIQPYISDGLVFHLDGSDFDSQNMKWTDKIGNIVFNMYNVSSYNGKGVKFNGNTNSYGRSSTIVNYSYTTSTIEIVQYRYAQSGFVFDPANVNAIRYIQGGTYVNFTYGAASKRSGISTQSLNKISTHSINMDRDVFNGTSYNFVSNDTWAASSSNTYLGIRNGASYPLNGIIYQIRIYNRKLSLLEILYNLEQDKKRYGIIF